MNRKIIAAETYRLLEDTGLSEAAFFKDRPMNGEVLSSEYALSVWLGETRALPLPLLLGLSLPLSLPMPLREAWCDMVGELLETQG